MKEKIDIGYMGECYILYKLATLGIKGENLKNLFDYDILLDNNCKIEVKTSQIGKAQKKVKDKIYEWKRWQFHNHKLDNKTKKTYKRKRICDYFILIGLDENNNIGTCFIVPEKELTECQSITIPIHNNNKNKFNIINRYYKYKEKWELLIENYFD